MSTIVLRIEVLIDGPPPPDEPINCECSSNEDARSLGELRLSMLERLGYPVQADIIRAGTEAAWPPGMRSLLTGFLQTANRLMFRRYEQLRTRRFFQWALEAGVKFYDIKGNDIKGNDDTCPAIMDPRRIKWVGIERDGVWYELQHGIRPELYTWDQPTWPVRYEIRECIEIWPRPAEGSGRLMIKADATLFPFAADADKPSVDDEVVFLWAMASAKAHYRQPDAGDYAAQAQQHIRDLVAGLHMTARYIPGEGPQQARREPVPDGVDLWFPGYTP